MTKAKAWSYSALKNFENCPKKFWHLSVEKDVKEPPSEHLAYGDTVHKAFQARVEKAVQLPLGMGQHEQFLCTLAGTPGQKVCEQKLAINADFHPVEWFAKDVWARVVIDLAIINEPTAFIVDYKTGKRHEDDDQLALMALVLFSSVRHLDRVHAAFYWLQEPAAERLDARLFEREDMGAIANRFLPRVEQFQRAHAMTEFPPRPSGLCRRHCPVKSCPHNGS